MEALLGSHTKAEILCYLGLKGGSSGRQLSRTLGKSPTQVFKALRSLRRAEIVTQHGPPYHYTLNPRYPFYEELLQIIHKHVQRHPVAYLPKVPASRRVDPLAIYQLLAMRDQLVQGSKLSDVLRERYD